MNNAGADLVGTDKRAPDSADQTRDIDIQVEPDQSADSDKSQLNLRLKRLRIVAAKSPAIVELVEALPKQFQVPAFTEFLKVLLEGSAAQQLGASSVRRHSNVPVSLPSGVQTDTAADVESPMARLASALGATTDSLRRVVQLDKDGDVQILVRVDGRSTRERQVRLAALVAYVREKAFGEMHTDVEMIRKVCVTHGAYDSANFSSNFKKEGSLRAVTIPGTNERRYVLAPEGVQVAFNLFKQLLES
jgi:hypothetical protein